MPTTPFFPTTAGPAGRCLRAHRSRWLTALLAIVLNDFYAPALAQPAAITPASSPANAEITLEDAVARAFAASPELRAAEANLAEARGKLTGARTYPFNPVLEGSAAARSASGERGTDYDVGVSQELEIAGQRGKRIDTAKAELSAERSRLLGAQRLIAARVHLAFVTALQTRDLLEVSRRDLELVQRLHELAQRRLERGAGTQLDINVAGAERGRAEARFQSATADYDVARASLAEAMGADASNLPQPKGTLRADLPPLPPRAELLESGRTNRADLKALRQIEAANRARYELARSEAWPNLTLRAFGGHEEFTNTVIGGGVSIPIPFFNRNQGQVQETLAGIQRAEADRATGELSATREVVDAYARYRATTETAGNLRRLVLGTLEDSLDLLQRSFEAGKATWPEVIVIRRSLVDAQRELADAEAEARRSWTELQLAAGQMPLPDQIKPKDE